MTRTAAISAITSTIEQLPDEQVQVLAEIAHGLVDNTPVEDELTLKTVMQGVNEAKRGEYIPEDEMNSLLNTAWL